MTQEDNEAEERLKYTNNKCGVWSHAECLEKTDNTYVCVLISNMFYMNCISFCISFIYW